MSDRVLLVEDEKGIADNIEFILKETGYVVTIARDGKQALRMFNDSRPDLVVLDLNLPHVSGLEVFREIRRQTDTPVIMVTSRAGETDRILGLEMGADDYVTKPFVPRELAARVSAVLRRYRNGNQASNSVLEEGPVRIDKEARLLSYYGTRMELTRSEYALLLALASHPAKTYSRDELLNRIHDGEYAPTDRTIDACVKRIRAKAAAIRPDVNPIQTSYGMGYKLNQNLPAS